MTQHILGVLLAMTIIIALAVAQLHPKKPPKKGLFSTMNNAVYDYKLPEGK